MQNEEIAASCMESLLVSLQTSYSPILHNQTPNPGFTSKPKFKFLCVLESAWVQPVVTCSPIFMFTYCLTVLVPER